MICGHEFTDNEREISEYHTRPPNTILKFSSSLLVNECTQVNPDNTRIRLTCLHCSCHPIQVMLWFICEVTVQLWNLPHANLPAESSHGNREVNTLAEYVYSRAMSALIFFIIQIEHTANKKRQSFSQPKPWCNDSGVLNLHHDSDVKEVVSSGNRDSYSVWKLNKN